MTTKVTASGFATLHAEAHAAGMAAGQAAIPATMVVCEAGLNGQPTPGGKTWYETEGVCGFAWVAFAGNTPFGRWAKQAGIASKHYPTGLSVWVGEFGQSMTRKEAYAHAYANVLAHAGVPAHAGSRMD